MKYLVLTVRGAAFDAAVLPAHYSFLDALREQGRLEQAGPFSDRSGGAYVLRGESLDEALAMIREDPLHVHGCSTFVIREWDAK